MKDALYIIVDWIAGLHDGFLKINDRTDAALSDKQLHFIIIGALGLVIFFATHFVFKRLAKKSVAAISWIYTLTVIGVITFAIEIGQYVTKTGNMEAMDIIMGVLGALCFGAAYTVLARLFTWVKKRRGGKG